MATTVYQGSLRSLFTKGYAPLVEEIRSSRHEFSGRAGRSTMAGRMAGPATRRSRSSSVWRDRAEKQKTPDWYRASSRLVQGPDQVACLTAMPALVQMLLQLAGLEHFAHDIGAADEFALHIELRDGRPVGVVLDALAQFVAFEHVGAADIRRRDS